jgi:hypothetical protein
MRRLRSIGFAFGVILCFAPAVSAQDFDDRFDESNRGFVGPYGSAGWTGNQQVEADAHRLSQQSARVAERLQRAQGNTYLSHQAIQLANAAQRFDQAVSASAPPQQVMQSFMSLQQQYYDTRTALFRANRGANMSQLNDDWARLAASHERLALSMGIEETQYCANAGQSGYGGPVYGQVTPGYRYGQRVH